MFAVPPPSGTALQRRTRLSGEGADCKIAWLWQMMLRRIHCASGWPCMSKIYQQMWTLVHYMHAVHRPLTQGQVQGRLAR